MAELGSGTRCFVAVMAAAGVIVCGCAGKGPAEVARDYLDGLKLYNYRACYQMLSHQDRADLTMESFLTEPPLAPDVSRDWFKAVLRVVNYEVGLTRADGRNRAVVEVRTTRPDLPLWERTIDATIDPGASPDEKAQKTLDDGSYPKLSYDDEIVTVRQHGFWRVLADFPVREKAEKKHREALSAYHRHDYDKAIAVYQTTLSELSMKRTTGGAGLRFIYQRELNQIESVKNHAAEERAYIPKLALSNVAMKMSASHLPGMFGEIKNTGGRAVDEVICTVTYYAATGQNRKAVYSEEHTIIATPLEFVNFSRPVLPFVPSEARNFGFTLTAPAEIQRQATPDVRVTAIAFTQSTAPLPNLPSAEKASSTQPAQSQVPSATASPSPASR